MKKGKIYWFIGFLLVSPMMAAQDGNTDYQYALIEAVKQKNLGNLPGAIELYQMVLKENDKVAVAHYELGTLLAMTGENEKALTELLKAYEMEPENEWYFGSYTDVLLMNKDYEIAEKVIKEKIKSDPQKVEYSFQLANLYYLSDKENKALKILENIENRYGISDKIILLKATIYEKKKDYVKALAEVDKIISHFPENVQYYVVAAELAMNGKKDELAASYYKEVLDLDSSNIYALTNLTDYYRDRKELSKSFYYLNKSFGSDEIEYSKKMAILSYYLSDQEFSGNNVDLLEPLIVTLLQKYPDKREIHLFGSDFFVQERKYKEALESLKPVLGPKERRYELWKQGILLANATQSMETLLKLSQDASEIFPDSSEILFYRGIAEYELERYNEAVKSFSGLSEMGSGRKEVVDQSRLMLAESYSGLKEYSKSDSLFRVIIKENPENYVAMNNFGYYLAQRNENLEEAEKISNIAVVKNPNNATFLDTYAWILYKMNDFEGAERYIMDAISKGGENDADVIEHAGDIHVALKSIHLARAFYQKAILLGGDKDRLLQKINELTGQNAP